MALALALAPILVLSAFQSRTAFEQEESRSEQELAAAAAGSSRAVQAQIAGSIGTLRSLMIAPDQPDCRARLSEVVRSGEQFNVLALADPSGQIRCASQAGPRLSIASQPWFGRLREGDGIVFSATPPSQLSGEPSLLAAVSLKDSHGEPSGVAVGIIPVLSLRPAVLERGSGERIDVALADDHGHVLAATDRQAFPNAPLTRQDLSSEPTRIIDARGQSRVLGAAVLVGDDLYMVASTPSQTLYRWALANALGVFVLPLLTWLTALICVLVVTDRVVVRWLYYLERVATLQARGRLSVRPVYARNGPEEIRSLAQAMDEMVLAISARDASLRDSLEEKDALMREIHHRVKNNLQVISSLLSMQQRALSDPTARAALGDTRKRISALALIYRALYQSETLKQVDFDTLLNDLVAQLMTPEQLTGPAVDTQVQADRLVVDPDKLAPVALWAVEAISNAQKHALRDRGGRLAVRFQSGPEDSILEVEDNGPGLEDGDLPSGLGQTLMTAFARQLRGTTTFERGPMGGLLVRLSFPTPEVSLELLTDSAGRRNHRAA